MTRFDLNPEGCYVYFITPEDEEATTKIGISKDPFRRMEILQCAHSKELTLQIFFGPWSRRDAVNIEREIHQKLAERKIRGEWFGVNYRVCWQFFDMKELRYYEGCEI